MANQDGRFSKKTVVRIKAGFVADYEAQGHISDYVRDGDIVTIKGYIEDRVGRVYRYVVRSREENNGEGYQATIPPEFIEVVRTRD